MNARQRRKRERDHARRHGPDLILPWPPSPIHERIASFIRADFETAEAIARMRPVPGGLMATFAATV